MSYNRTKKNRGMLLVLVIASVFALLILAFSLSSSGVSRLSGVLHVRESEGAYYAAQAGVARAFYAVEANDATLPACGASSTPAILSNQSLSNGESFTVIVTNNYNYSSGNGCVASVTAPDGTVVSPGLFYFNSTGSAPHASRNSKATIRVSRGYGLFATGNVRLTGSSLVDSFNSKAGVYGGLNVTSHGTIGTNSIAGGAITLRNTTNVSGRVDVGPGGNPGPPQISATVGTGYSSAGVLSSSRTLPAVVDPLGGSGVATPSSGPIAPGKYGSIVVTGTNTLTLTCGVYSMSGLTLNSSAQVIIDSTCSFSNPVKVYVYNTLQLNGNGVSNAGDLSTRFLIFGMPSLATVGLTGNGISAYTLYAPNAAITVNSGNIYGSLIGSTLTSASGRIHYDEALNNDPYANFFADELIVKGWSSQY